MHAPLKKEKQKSQLVFKLLKTMDPYHPQMNQQSQFIKSKLYSILQQQNGDMIEEEGTQQNQQSEKSFDLSKNDMINSRHTISQLSSRVINVMVRNGRVDEGERPRVKFELEEDNKKQTDTKRQWNSIRKQIESIQNNVFKKFNIYKQTKNLYYQKGSHQNIRKDFFSESNHQIVNKFASPTDTFFSSKIRDNYVSQNRSTGRLTSKVLNSRQENGYSSPIKSYRHERQQSSGVQKRVRIVELGQTNKKVYDSLNLISTPVKRSKSSQSRVQKQGLKKIEKEKQKKIFQGKKDDYLNSIKRKISEKAIKQMKDYDVQVMGTILQRKLNFNDTTNKISSLVQ